MTPHVFISIFFPFLRRLGASHHRSEEKGEIPLHPLPFPTRSPSPVLSSLLPKSQSVHKCRLLLLLPLTLNRGRGPRRRDGIGRVIPRSHPASPPSAVYPTKCHHGRQLRAIPRPPLQHTVHTAEVRRESRKKGGKGTLPRAPKIRQR